MFIDLVYQVQKLLRLENGGLANRKGLARGVVFKARNQSGASMPVGSTVKRHTSYNFEIVQMTTATDDAVIGVSVGNVDTATDVIDPDTATANGDTVAVATGGAVDVRLGADVTAGQYAFAHATDGTAYSSATATANAFGQFLTSGTSGNKASVLLFASSRALTLAHSATTGQTTDDHHAQDHASRHESTGADPLRVYDIVLMTDGTTNPPEPIWTEDGTDWLYEG